MGYNLICVGTSQAAKLAVPQSLQCCSVILSAKKTSKEPASFVTNL